MTTDPLQIIPGDCRETLKTIPDESVQCCVTSPPYWGLRDYGHENQIGQEKTPEEFVANLVAVFREVRRILRPDGIAWINLGDSYTSGGREGHGTRVGYKQATNRGMNDDTAPARAPMPKGLKPKDLVGIPWMTAFALRADGWYLRQDIIWSKPNPMPESVTDRCTKAHEYIFLLSKSARYFYDAAAIAEPLAYGSVERLSQPNLENQNGSDRAPGKTNGTMKAVVATPDAYKGSVPGRKGGPGQDRRSTNPRGYSKPYINGSTKDYESGGAQDASATKARIVDRILAGEIVTRNKRSVWTVSTKPFKDAHFATFPEDLITPCILAGTKPGDTVIDPFGGSGTTGKVALDHGRRAILCELNPKYITIAEKRNSNMTPGLAL